VHLSHGGPCLFDGDGVVGLVQEVDVGVISTEPFERRADAAMNPFAIEVRALRGREELGADEHVVGAHPAQGITDRGLAARVVVLLRRIDPVDTGVQRRASRCP
jgi:hypothetical protein